MPARARKLTREERKKARAQLWWFHIKKPESINCSGLGSKEKRVYSLLRGHQLSFKWQEVGRLADAKLAATFKNRFLWSMGNSLPRLAANSLPLTARAPMKRLKILPQVRMQLHNVHVDKVYVTKRYISKT